MQNNDSNALEDDGVLERPASIPWGSANGDDEVPDAAPAYLPSIVNEDEVQRSSVESAPSVAAPSWTDSNEPEEWVHPVSFFDPATENIRRKYHRYHRFTNRKTGKKMPLTPNRSAVVAAMAGFVPSRKPYSGSYECARLSAMYTINEEDEDSDIITEVCRNHFEQLVYGLIIISREEQACRTCALRSCSFSCGDQGPLVLCPIARGIERLSEPSVYHRSFRLDCSLPLFYFVSRSLPDKPLSELTYHDIASADPRAVAQLVRAEEKKREAAALAAAELAKKEEFDAFWRQVDKDGFVMFIVWECLSGVPYFLLLLLQLFIVSLYFVFSGEVLTLALDILMSVC